MSPKIISLKKWLSLFDVEIISYKEFYNTFYVKSSIKKTLLKDLVKNGRISKENSKLLYKRFVLEKEKYLINFFNKSLLVPKNIDLKNIKLSLNNTHNAKYKNLIRNIYYKELLLYTKTEIKNLRPFLEVILDLFKNKTIDYKLITPSSIAMLERNLLSNILSGYYFRSSILNPSITYTLSQKYLKGSKIFTPTLGWSSYMMGFMNSDNVKEYVGTDVIEDVCKNTEKLSKKYFPDKRIEIYHCPSEKLRSKKNFIKKYKNYFDVIFFSPPYFKLEIYRGELQSTNQYQKYDEWLEKYWHATIKLCKDIINPNGKMCYIISNYKNRMNINEDMNNITKKYFRLVNKKSLSNSNVGFTSHRDTGEVIFFFKPN